MTNLAWAQQAYKDAKVARDRAICEAAGYGMSVREIAAEVGLSPGTVQAILSKPAR